MTSITIDGHHITRPDIPRACFRDDALMEQFRCTFTNGRPSGGGARAAYDRGYSGLRCPYVPTSISHVIYHAGRARAIAGMPAA